MKIKTINVEVKDIVLKKAFITALRRVETIEFVRVYMVCDNGMIGIGEAPATKVITGEDIKTILDSIDKIKNNLIGLTLDEALKVLHFSKIGSSAKASLDIAIVSLMNFFKIQNKKPIKTDITISLNVKEQMIKDAKEAYENGMDILKIKLGSDINHAIKVTKELSQRLPQVKLLIDANQAWSLSDSFHYINTIKDINIQLIEQPVIAQDLESLKIITNSTDIPILADETVFNLSDVKKVYEMKVANMINIKLMKCGGVTQAVKILQYAREKNISCMLGSMLEGPYSINAALYLAFNYRDVIKYVDLDSPLLYKKQSEELDFSFNGSLVIPKF